MTAMTTAQRRQLAAAQGVVAKLQVFHEGLTSDEQQLLAAALHCIGTEMDGAADDVAGYLGPELVGVAVLQQMAVREVVTKVLDLFGISGSPRT